MPQLGDFMEKSSARDVELLQNEIAIFKNLIQERAHPLDLVRELLSNAAAREVGAAKIEISYTKGRDGHVFEVIDDGCGMTYTGYAQYPGRLDRFLGLGMSAIVGEKADEFSWKGLGSKLAYQSKRVEIETRSDGGSLFSVTVNEPWSSLERNLLPKPRLSEYEDSHEPTGSRIVVTGHPPHRLEEPFTFEEIRAFLLHRTFAGFTRERDKPPSIILSVLGQTEELNFGFPEFRDIEWPDGIALDTSGKRLLVNILVKSPKIGVVRLKGFLTWDANRYDLSKSRLNTGLILSSRGIPYFALDLDDYGARGISHANPGVEKTCLVVECDGVHARMNISRSDLVDCPESVELKKAVKKLFEKLETSQEYLAFRQIPKRQKQVAAADHIAEEKRTIESDEQK